MALNRVRIRICGSEYIVGTEDSEEYTQNLAERLDTELGEFLAQNPSASITAAAVLTALDYMDRMEKSSSGADNMRSQVKEYLEDAAKAKMETEEVRRALNEVRHENERLKKELGYTDTNA